MVEQINQIRREWERAENDGDPSIIDRKLGCGLPADAGGMEADPGDLEP